MNIRHNEAFSKVINPIKIEVMESGFCDLDREWRKEYECSPFSRLYYVISGEGYLRLHGCGHKKNGRNNGKEELYVMRPGHLYLIPNGLSYDYFCEDRLEKVHIHINVVLENGLELFKGCDTVYEMQVDQSLLEQMKKWITSDKTEDFFHLQGEIYHAVAGFMKIAGMEEKLNAQYSGMVSRVFALLPGMSTAVSVREIAEILNVSESTLAKRFKKETGMSIGSYREQLIMNRARQLLAIGRMSVGEIADELGFGDRLYFSKYFKQRQGMTPSEYKKYYV